EGTGQRISAGTYNIEIDDPSQAGAVSKAIDAQFENSDAQTHTETEQAFAASFIAMAGNLAFLLNSIGLAVSFTILLVTANTMSMAVRERLTEQAFAASFIAMAGNLAFLLNSIGLAVSFTILLVTANTMSMAVRERRTEIA